MKAWIAGTSGIHYKVTDEEFRQSPNSQPTDAVTEWCHPAKVVPLAVGCDPDKGRRRSVTVGVWAEPEQPADGCSHCVSSQLLPRLSCSRGLASFFRGVVFQVSTPLVPCLFPYVSGPPVSQDIR